MSKTKSSNWDSFWEQQKSCQAKNISWSKRRILSVMSPYLVAGKHALDAGCGSGFFSTCFCDQGMQTVALDYSQSALDIALKQTSGRADIVKADLLANDLGKVIDKKFDLIFSDGLFEHFSKQDQNKIMANLKTVVADDGIIVTVVPNRWSPWQLIRPIMMPGISEVPFVLKELLELNQSQDLQVMASGGLNTFPFRISPEGDIAKIFGMVLFTIAKKRTGS